MTTDQRPPATPEQQLVWTNRMLGAVTKAAGSFFRESAPTNLFEGLLEDLLALTESDYGYIAEVLHDSDGNPYLQTWAITNIAWNDITQALYDEFAVRGEGLQFRNLDTLFGWGLRDGGRLVISNASQSDPRASGRPAGHPPLNSFLGIPVFRGRTLVGQLGVSNRVGGYDEDVVVQLEPFVIAIGSLIDASRAHRERGQAEAERRHSEQESRQRSTELAALVGGLREAVLFVNDRFEIVFMNQVFCDMWGYDAPLSRLVGNSSVMDGWLARRRRGESETELPRPMRLVRAPDEFAAGIDAINTAGVLVIGDRVEMLDGRMLERDYLPVPSENGLPGHLWIYRDVTERFLLEQERQALLDIEREQRRLSEEQTRSLLELDRLKSEFVAAVSHELRTPLTSIVGFAELLVEDEALSPTHREFVEIITRNSHRLLDMIGDLLLVGRLEFGGLKIQRRLCGFSSLVDAALATFSVDVAAKRLELAIDLSDDTTPALIDASRFDQVVRNLVSNAIKFTPEGGRVSVRTVRQPGAWVLEVADTGIGIPDSEITSVSERFFRGTNARLAGLPGSGLGLAIVKVIVDLHQGMLAISSGGWGTMVEVSLADPDPAAALIDGEGLGSAG